MNARDRERRFRLIVEIGCLAARRRGWYLAPDIHHLNLGGHAGQKRRGDEYTIGLSPWSHRGVPLEGRDREWCRHHLGPSLALEPNKFRAEFGEDDELLAEQDRLIECYAQQRVGA